MLTLMSFFFTFIFAFVLANMIAHSNSDLSLGQRLFFHILIFSGVALGCYFSGPPEHIAWSSVLGYVSGYPLGMHFWGRFFTKSEFLTIVRVH